MKALTAFAFTAALLTAGGPAFAGLEGKNTVRAERQASCQTQAAKKYSAIHFIKRNQFVKNCMGETTHAKAKKPMPSTTGQSVK
jgi:hypothetical protein